MARKSGSVSLEEFTESILPATIRSLSKRGFGGRDFEGIVTVGFIIGPSRPGGFGGANPVPIEPSPVPSMPDNVLILRAAQLTPSDHTAVVRAVMENAEDLLKSLFRRGMVPLRSQISVREVAEAAADVPGFDDRTRYVLQLAAEGSGIRDEGLARLDRSAAEAMAKIEAEIYAQDDLSGVLRFLKKSLGRSNVDEVEGLRTGLEFAIGILEDGMDTIYSPDFVEQVVVYSKKKSAGDHAKDVGKNDAAGAVGGAVGGAAAGAIVGSGPGAVGGAVIMGVGSSVKEVVSKIIDWLW